ncbi:MAG: response regulator [Alphaproteobacteria bacterium]|nr:response regulator [Alphaproteobacteria bacterium]
MTTEPGLERILYIDDEEVLRRVTRAVLEKAGGFTVAVASSGKEGLALAPAFKPDLIVLDVMMPEMDGPTTLAALRTLPDLSKVPVVFLTAKAQPSEIERLRDLGAAEVLTKPFEPQTLCRDLHRIWSAARARDQVSATDPWAAPELQAALEEMRQVFRDGLSDHLLAIVAARDALFQTGADATTPRATLRARAHRITGTARTIGLGSLGDRAAEVEDLLVADASSAALLGPIDALLAAIEEERRTKPRK